MPPPGIQRQRRVHLVVVLAAPLSTEMAGIEINEPPGDAPENVTPNDVNDGDPFRRRGRVASKPKGPGSPERQRDFTLKERHRAGPRK